MAERLFQENPTDNTTQIQGVLDRITYQNEENGYTVARFLSQSREKNSMTVVGFLAGVPVGSTLCLTGAWITT